MMSNEMNDALLIGISKYDQNKALFKDLWLSFKTPEKESFMGLASNGGEELCKSVHSVKDTEFLDVLCLCGVMAVQEAAIEILREKINGQ